METSHHWSFFPLLPLTPTEGRVTSRSLPLISRAARRPWTWEHHAAFQFETKFANWSTLAIKWWMKSRLSAAANASSFQHLIAALVSCFQLTGADHTVTFPSLHRLQGFQVQLKPWLLFPSLPPCLLSRDSDWSLFSIGFEDFHSGLTTSNPVAVHRSYFTGWNLMSPCDFLHPFFCWSVDGRFRYLDLDLFFFVRVCKQSCTARELVWFSCLLTCHARCTCCRPLAGSEAAPLPSVCCLHFLQLVGTFL